MSRELQDLRAALRQLDRDLVDKLDERGELAAAVGEAKRRARLPIFDAAQEAAVLARLREHSSGALPLSALHAIYREIMTACASMQVQTSDRICVSVAPANLAAAGPLLDRAEAESPLVELRMDTLAATDLAALLTGRRVRFVVTDRASREGGRSPRGDEERVALLIEAVRLGVAYVDLELATDPGLVARLRAAIAADDGTTALILSHHDPQGTPTLDVLQDILAAARRAGADVAKIVTTATSASDADRVLALYPRARAMEQPLTAFCMGRAGRESRVAAMRAGAAIGYANLPDAAPTAPGQWTTRQLRLHLLREPQRYVVLGHPARHSLSPLMFGAAFAALDIPATYEARDVATAAEAAALLRDGGFAGASVTMPHKAALLPLLDDVDAEARAIGAVNTVTVLGGRLHGANTDGPGLLACLREQVTLGSDRIAVIGAGGAARAAVHALQSVGAEVVVLCRDLARAGDLPCEVRPLTALRAVGACGLVSAIPAAPASPVTPGDLAGLRWVMDMVYASRPTPLLVDAAAAGCVAIGGAGMLVHQGAAQFARWLGREAPTDLMAAVVRGALAWGSA